MLHLCLLFVIPRSLYFKNFNVTFFTVSVELLLGNLYLLENHSTMSLLSVLTNVSIGFSIGYNFNIWFVVCLLIFLIFMVFIAEDHFQLNLLIETFKSFLSCPDIEQKFEFLFNKSWCPVESECLKILNIFPFGSNLMTRSWNCLLYFDKYCMVLCIKFMTCLVWFFVSLHSIRTPQSPFLIVFVCFQLPIFEVMVLVVNMEVIIVWWELLIL